ncbi:branched-chain amino acid ABC transporter permease [Candidatus Aerophobetes bacterium]|uniref:Branched-chain amino acid ABC transporter permease n=1 Tax=Aerophobetes bacterium TaxID=2030807 RepID=A0A523TAQ9_UNCAE|nr:MAG: branched-chain amino acid ABC transporter permease [Candidatus Aerophobetes bacterium]
MESTVGALNYMVFFAITAGIYAILCLGLNIQWGYTGLFNIGIAGFYAVGAYTSALLSGPPPGPLDWRTFGGFQLPFPAGLLGAILISGIIAAFIGFLTLRLKEDYLAIATIGIAEVIRLILKNESWLTNSVWGMKHIPPPLHHPIQRGISGFISSHPDLSFWIRGLISNAYNWFYLAMILAILGTLYWVSERSIRSPWGRVLRAIREDETVVAAAGKNVFQFKMQSFILGAMIMGMAGSLYAHYAKFIDANSFEPLYGTFLIWVMLIAGGSGNSKGAILGAFVIWGIWAGTDFITGYLALSATRVASLRVIAIAVLLELVLLLRPQGLLGEEKVVSKMMGK